MGLIRYAFTVSPMVLALACAPQASADETPEQQEAESAVPIQSLVLDDEIGSEGQLVEAIGGATAQFDPSCLITPGAVANIPMPATLEEFSAAFPIDTAMRFTPTFMVDFGALCVRAEGEDALCAIFESYQVEGYDPQIPAVGLAVYAPQCRTAEGVGPGTTIEDAVEAYGAATFSFSFDNEGREYVAFAEAPEAYGFRAEAPGQPGDPSPNGRHGGDYAGTSGDGGFYETGNARPGARIWEVWVTSSR